MSGQGDVSPASSSAATSSRTGADQLEVRMTFEHGAALARLIVRYLSLPEAPLVPPAEERLVLDVYEVLLDVMVPWTMTRSEFDGEAARSRPVKGAGGEAR